MLKHALEHHREEDPIEVRFQTKLLSYHKSSFERQICEAVKIQYNRENNILNSKSEYNRSSIRRLGVKTYKTRKEHADGDREEVEREIEERIRMLRKKHGKKSQRRKLSGNPGWGDNQPQDYPRNFRTGSIQKAKKQY